MSVKSFFKSSRYLTQELQLLNREKENLQANNNSESKKYLEILNQKIQELYNRKAKLFDFINLANTPTERIILKAHYIDNIPLRQLSENIGYSERHIQRLLRQALNTIEKEVNKNGEKHNTQ